MKKRLRFSKKDLNIWALTAEDDLMWERRYNTCFEARDKLHKQLDECVDMLDRVLLHVDLDDVNPPLKKQIQELLNKIQ